jgi:hypothetical protein
LIKKVWLQRLREDSAYEPISRHGSNFFRIVFIRRAWNSGKWHIGSHYPTQAKVRLEWGTQHLLPVWQKLW